MTTATTSHQCPVDIYETDKAYILLADMPGVSSDKISIELEGKQLSLKADIEQEGLSWQRRFQLNQEIDRSTISASHENGVLRVQLPKPPAPSPRLIPVSSSASL